MWHLVFGYLIGSAIGKEVRESAERQEDIRDSLHRIEARGISEESITQTKQKEQEKKLKIDVDKYRHSVANRENAERIAQDYREGRRGPSFSPRGGYNSSNDLLLGLLIFLVIIPGLSVLIAFFPVPTLIATLGAFGFFFFLSVIVILLEN